MRKAEEHRVQLGSHTMVRDIDCLHLRWLMTAWMLLMGPKRRDGASRGWLGVQSRTSGKLQGRTRTDPTCGQIFTSVR